MEYKEVIKNLNEVRDELRVIGKEYSINITKKQKELQREMEERLNEKKKKLSNEYSKRINKFAEELNKEVNEKLSNYAENLDNYKRVQDLEKEKNELYLEVYGVMPGRKLTPESVKIIVKTMKKWGYI